MLMSKVTREKKKDRKTIDMRTWKILIQLNLQIGKTTE